LITAFIQDQHAAGQVRPRRDLGLNLVKDGLARPGRIGHEVLEGLSVIIEGHHAPGNLGIRARRV
jgi:hypothetical protein